MKVQITYLNTDTYANHSEDYEFNCEDKFVDIKNDEVIIDFETDFWASFTVILREISYEEGINAVSLVQEAIVNRLFNMKKGIVVKYNNKDNDTIYMIVNIYE